MLSKLPRWIWLGVGVLAFVAGMINVVALVGFEKIPVSHSTGNTSALGIAISGSDWSRAMQLIEIIGSFVLGTIAGGFVVKDNTLRLGRRYGVSLFIECLLLCAAVPFLNRLNPIGVCLLAAACGLQNAMASTYSGSIIRTTHITGMYTDLGIFLGQRLAGVKADINRFKLCVLIITGFLLGGMAGAISIRFISYNTIFIPAGITGTASFAYSVYRIRKSRLASDEDLPHVPQL